ncbi:MAG: O-antigen ligase family protein [Bacteroidales bacterium]|nr:O-antigen ligase family protein [Bacteroidales bacterium]MCF8398262.1 O-antigen ligase family protein [Bacteroidales bacterium]
MKKLFPVKPQVFHWIYLVLFCSLVVFLPLMRSVIPYIVALILIIWLTEKPWFFLLVLIYVPFVWHTQSAILIASGIILSIALLELLFYLIKKPQWKHFESLKQESFRQNILAFSAFYLLYMLGLTYSANLDYGSFDMEVKFSLFIFPLVFSTMNKEVMSRRNIMTILLFFIAGCLFSSLYSLWNSYQEFLLSGSKRVFYYDEVSFFHHPSYMAMYLDFAVASLIFFMIRKSDFGFRQWHLGIFIFLIIFFSVMVIMLSSKAGILSLMIIYFITIGHLMVIEKKLMQGLLLIMLVFVLFYVSLSFFSYSLNRIITSKDVMEETEQISKSTSEGTGERILIWTYALEIIEKNIFVGVGTGDVKDKLLKKYEDNKIQAALEQELNAHNQYLQTFIALGLLGFVALMLMFILPLYLSIRKQSFLYLVFLLIVAFNLLVESMFEKQDGVVFYAFFNAFLFFMVSGEQRKFSDLAT